MKKRNERIITRLKKWDYLNRTCVHRQCLGRCIPEWHCDPPAHPLFSSLLGGSGIGQCHRPALLQPAQTLCFIFAWCIPITAETGKRTFIPKIHQERRPKPLMIQLKKRERNLCIIQAAIRVCVNFQFLLALFLNRGSITHGCLSCIE